MPPSVFAKAEYVSHILLGTPPLALLASIRLFSLYFDSFFMSMGCLMLMML